MSAPIFDRGRIYYLGDEELFVRVTEVAYDLDYEIVTYQIRTVWVDTAGGWQECRTINVSLEYQPEFAACLAGLTGELQPAQLVYATDPDRSQTGPPIGTVIGDGETRFLLFN